MTDDATPPFRGSVHLFPVRIYYEDTDAGGIVYYANYLKFAERARTEMAWALGVDQVRLLADEGIAFTVRRCVADYRAPARLGDLVMVESRIDALGGASMEIAQRIRREGQDLVRFAIRLACVGRGGRPARWPAPVRSAFASLCNGSEQEERWIQP